MNRRSFLKTTAAGSAAIRHALLQAAPLLGAAVVSPLVHAADEKPALLGGKAVHSGGWTRWPQWREAWEPEVLKVYRSGKWFRGSDKRVEEFESRSLPVTFFKICAN